MQTESCKLDYLPAYILKDLIDTFIPVLSKIVNLSLKWCVFGRVQDGNFVATVEKMWSGTY